MKIVSAFFAFFLAVATCASAQTYSLNLSTSFAPAWGAPAISGTATNIGASGVNCSVSMTSTGGGATFITPYPRVNGAGDFVVGGSTASMEIDMNFTANTQYMEVVYSFSSSVNNVRFNISDIDKTNTTSTTYRDRVTVTGANGATTILPTLSKYTATSTFVTIASNVAQCAATGAGGNSASSATDQRGTVIVDFGVSALTSITVRYDNAAGAQADPALQAIAIGNISFQKVITLPLSLVDFHATGSAAGNELSWITSEEVNTQEFSIEKSWDGLSWAIIGSVQASGNSSRRNTYSFTDISKSGQIQYYRLKMVDKDGSFSYSKVVKLFSSALPAEGFSIFPNPATEKVTVALVTAVKQQRTIVIYNSTGVLLLRQQVYLQVGLNQIPVSLQNWQSGQYTLLVINENGAISGNKILIKR
jgi:Secretion system C-terminal sorting domain